MQKLASRYMEGFHNSPCTKRVSTPSSPAVLDFQLPQHVLSLVNTLKLVHAKVFRVISHTMEVFPFLAITEKWMVQQFRHCTISFPHNHKLLNWPSDVYCKVKHRRSNEAKYSNRVRPTNWFIFVFCFVVV